MHYSRNENLYEIEKMMRGIPNFRERGHGSMVLQTDMRDCIEEQPPLWRSGQTLARNNALKIEPTAYDELFQTDESREEAKLSKIRDIPISQIDEFPDHPFKVLMDGDMEQLVESIKRNGVMTPATVRLKEDGRYELSSGHRRKKACELAGLETLKCEVKELTRDEAIIIMVESNLQRSVILPSEKAFAYKIRLEAMNRQGQRSDLTSVPYQAGGFHKA